MHCAYQLDASDNSRPALRGELCRGEYVLVEQLEFIAAELLDVLAPDAGGRLSQDLDRRAVDKVTFVLANGPGEKSPPSAI